MKKTIIILLAIVFLFAFSSTANAQITRDEYYARSTLSGEELEYYDAAYNAILAGKTELDNRPYDISYDRATKIINYIWADAPELICLRNSLYTSEEITAYQKQINQTAEKILSLVSDDMTDYEKVETIFYWLAENLRYGENEEAKDDGQTIVGALVYGEATCGGLSKALQYLLYKTDIPCYTVNGTLGTGPHGWNIIQIDGKWYNTDITMNLRSVHGNFLFGDEIFLKIHHIDPEMNPPLPGCPENYVEPEPTPTPEPTATPTREPAPVVANVEPQEPPREDGQYVGWIILAVAAAGAALAVVGWSRHKSNRKR